MNILQGLRAILARLFPADHGIVIRRGPQGRYRPKPQPTPPPKPAPPADGKVLYYYNDPTTPILTDKVSIPQGATALRINVHGFNGNSDQQAAQVYITLHNLLSHINGIMGKMDRRLERWAATPVLQIIPKAGVQLNAFYDRGSLRFYYDTEPNTNNVVYTCDSTDVVSHECGHAVIDSLRPDLWGRQALEIFAFHESGADCMAISHILMHDKIIDHIFSETGGDLRKSNVASRVGEELGQALTRMPGGLRDAVNDFKWTEAESLPIKGPREILTKEPHNFSRVWTGAWYDILIGIYDNTPGDRKNALKIANHTATMYLLGALAVAPARPRFFAGMAQAMIAIDASVGSPMKSVLEDVFRKRNIFEVQAQMLPDVLWRDVRIGPQDSVVKVGNSIVVMQTQADTGRVSDELHGMTWNPLYDVEVDLATSNYFEFDGSGNQVFAMSANRFDAVLAAKSCLDYLHEKDLVGREDHHIFEIVDGKLVRRRMMCCDGIPRPNSETPGQPEYGKGWKQKNNSGCCSFCNKTPDPAPPPPPKLGCYVKHTTCGDKRVVRSCNAMRIKVC